MNKKGGEKIFSLWWFLSITLVGTIIVAVVVIRFSTPVDVRPIEAMMLREKILGCMLTEGLFNLEIEQKTDILEFCKINNKTIKDSGKYLISIALYDEKEDLESSWEYGEKYYKEDCAISSEISTREYPFCIKTTQAIFYFNKISRKIESKKLELLVSTDNKGKKNTKISGGLNE